MKLNRSIQRYTWNNASFDKNTESFTLERYTNKHNQVFLDKGIHFSRAIYKPKDCASQKKIIILLCREYEAVDPATSPLQHTAQLPKPESCFCKPHGEGQAVLCPPLSRQKLQHRRAEGTCCAARHWASCQFFTQHACHKFCVYVRGKLAHYKTWQRKLKTQQWDHTRKTCLFKAWCGLYTGLETAGLYFLLFLNLSLLLHSEKSAGNTGIPQGHCIPNNTASTLPRLTTCKPKRLITRYFLKANLCHQSDPRLASPSAFPTQLRPYHTLWSRRFRGEVLQKESSPPQGLICVLVCSCQHSCIFYQWQPELGANCTNTVSVVTESQNF